MRLLYCFLFLLGTIPTFSQSALVPLNRDYYHLIDRYEIRNRRFATGFHSVVRPYSRQAIAQFTESILDTNLTFSKADRFNLTYLLNDNWEWTDKAENDSKNPVFNLFYKKKSDALYVQTEDFDLHVNPVAHFAWGNDNDSEETPYINTRGIVIRGSIGKKVGFFTYFTENQARFPMYAQQRIDSTNAIPNERFWKVNSEGSKNISQFDPMDGLDFMTARGYFTFSPIKQIQLQFGQDRNFIGNGYRSLILSDFAPEYLFLKINTKVWKLNYTNIFAQMNSRAPLVTNDELPKKFMTFHHLSLNVTENLNFGLFESVMFSRKDTLGNNYFDFEYLNPLIFYRAIELNLGDVDNVNLGMDFKWNFLNRFQLYGQFMIDDMLFTEFRRGSGWHGNKFASQLGGKYIDVAGISNLDLQMEFNSVRPYTYAHVGQADFGNFQHYGQPLAHPLGANFQEIIGIVRYQPIPRLTLTGKGMMTQMGEDPDPQTNWGSNIFLDYNINRPQDFDNETGQGVEASLMFIDFTASFQIRHNVFLDFKQVLRDYNSDIDSRDNSSTFTNLSFRWNIGQRLHEF